MGKVLVTGASGFIGGHLTAALARSGNSVRCLVRSSSDVSELRSLGIELVPGDVRDPAAVESAVYGTDVVYHVAGLTRALRKSDLWDVNERGTENVAAACAKQLTPPVHIYVSSIAAGGPTEYGRQRVESDPSTPVSNYGRSKLAGEHAARTQSHAVPTTIVRPGIVIGPKNRECLPIFETIDRSGIHPVAGFRSPALSYIHVDQLVDLLLRAARDGVRVPGRAGGSDSPGTGHYHASMDEFPNYAEFGRLIAKALGRSQAFVFPIAMPIPYIAAGVNEVIARWRGQPDPFNIDKIREANGRSWACSSALAQRQLGFRPMGTLSEQLESIVQWYREHGWLREPRRRSLTVRSRLTETHAQAAR